MLLIFDSRAFREKDEHTSIQDCLGSVTVSTVKIFFQLNEKVAKSKGN